jgi:sugar (pentulose or hexulose) kinase
MTATVAVIDVGKTNVRLSAATTDGGIVQTLCTPNRSLPGPPYRHYDLEGIEEWLLDGLTELGRRHPIEAIVGSAHGSACVLVDATGPVLPVVDYEQEPPAGLSALYASVVGSYRERGSPIMRGASHMARQLLWMETGWPEAFRRGTRFFGLPQYWAWRFGGEPAAELTFLSAQSHIWNARDRRPPPVMAARGWQHLIPPIRPAWASLGTLRPELARRTGLAPRTRLLCGIHDSTANFYRYQAAGIEDITVVSTGTWVVLVSSAADPDAISEAHGMCCNADIHGTPLAGALCMGGREYAMVAGDQAAGPADPIEVARLVAGGTMALPSFTFDDNLFPGHASRGRIAGPAPQTPEQRHALAVLYVALLIDTCLDALGRVGTIILDGVFVKEPLYAALVAALRPGERVLYNLESYGTAAGAALLAGHADRTAPAHLALERPARLDIPGLAAYRERWHSLANAAPEPAPMETQR